MSRRTPGNAQGKSGQRDDAGGSTLTRKVAEMDPDVAQALRKMAKTLPAGSPVNEAKLTRRAEEYKNARGTSKAKAKLYPLLGYLYDKLIELNAHPEKQDQFVRVLQKDRTIEWGADLSTLLVQFYLKRSEERYAHALCGAALKAIPYGGLARALGENTNSVNALATQFAERPKKPVRKTPKPCKLELLCSEKQWQRFQADDLAPSQRLTVERSDNGQLELIKAVAKQRVGTDF